MNFTPTRTDSDRSDGLTLWTALVVVVGFAVAIVVWAGVTQGDNGTPSAAGETTPNNVAMAPPPEDPTVTPQASILAPAAAPWAPGTMIHSTTDRPQPGESFVTHACTVAFSFTGDDGRAYAVTAGHCGQEGDLVWPTDATYAWDYATEAGTFIYSGMHHVEEGQVGVDVGVIEITDPQRHMEVVGEAIPTGLVEEMHTELPQVCKTGGSTGYTCGTFEHNNRVQLVMGEDGERVRTRGAIARVCAAKGDSGGPVFTEVNGRAAVIGVVSGTEVGVPDGECGSQEAPDMLMSYSTMEQALEVIRQVVPDADFVEQQW